MNAEIEFCLYQSKETTRLKPYSTAPLYSVLRGETTQMVRIRHLIRFDEW